MKKYLLTFLLEAFLTSLPFTFMIIVTRQLETFVHVSLTKHTAIMESGCINISTVYRCVTPYCVVYAISLYAYTILVYTCVFCVLCVCLCGICILSVHKHILHKCVVLHAYMSRVYVVHMSLCIQDTRFVSKLFNRHCLLPDNISNSELPNFTNDISTENITKKS